MFADGYVAWLVCRERNKDRWREADHYRLVQLALARHPGRPRYLCRALTWLGHRLVVWGRGLEQRYAQQGRVTSPLYRPSESTR
jgi:hypothetical protein